ncbi:zinc finger FYVE domain-containing protein 1-like isoform X1 [Chrysoperla carnea]|uniref:zinc finger FYVE domain-containing protein 1-like isoform X1 n=1 Tax=Chrysoperla carnea TaxID=189513 RepID=UPI001D05FD65|nr:zinc finger FYVE domain-containing protein 1-like isoform X1 [Chrysoperla carnea]
MEYLVDSRLLFFQNWVPRKNTQNAIPGMLRPNNHHTGSSIMQSLQSLDGRSLYAVGPPPDIPSSQLHSLKISEDDIQPPTQPGGSFLLIDGSEKLQVNSTTQLLKLLKIQDADTKIKVVSIFGNTGDGKSHTLNETFFDGKEVFDTGVEQGPRTRGVWAAWDTVNKALVLDTEGLKGVPGGNQNLYGSGRDEQRTRLLLKVLALSDVVVYRTKSECISRDLFTFLGAASRVYTQYFSAVLLKAINERIVDQIGGNHCDTSALGPALIIFHETRYMKVLESGVTESAEDTIRKLFADLKLDINAFSSLRYIGVQMGTNKTSPDTPWTDLRAAVRSALDDTTVRSPRTADVIFETLRSLNDTFSGDINSGAPESLSRANNFPDEYFSCRLSCESCGARCVRSMGHVRDGLPHGADVKKQCTYQHQYENCVYMCKSCSKKGIETVVTPKASTNGETNSWLGGIARYAWSGYTIDCPKCGEIYRSRQYWYGNQAPEDSDAVITKVIHVWPGVDRPTMSINGNQTQVSAQRVIDGVLYISEAVASVSAPPTRVVSSWFADQIAPKYWRPNHEIKYCHACHKIFEIADAKHHCRSCGEGFCDTCSQKQIPVPDRGWDMPVRVCNACYVKLNNLNGNTGNRASIDLLEEMEAEVRARRYGEAVVNTLSSVASAVIEYPRDFIKESARPSYWQPDSDAITCPCCNGKFGTAEPLHKGRVHHCRACGKAVCGDCSKRQRSVPERGWTEPVRVCDICYSKRSD